MFKSKKRCNYPECKNEPSKTWALVPLCELHHETIRLETGYLGGPGYYGKKYFNGIPINSDVDRTHYNQISHLIPWSKANMDFYKDGEEI